MTEDHPIIESGESFYKEHGMIVTLAFTVKDLFFDEDANPQIIVREDGETRTVTPEDIYERVDRENLYTI